MVSSHKQNSAFLIQPSCEIAAWVWSFSLETHRAQHLGLDRRAFGTHFKLMSSYLAVSHEDLSYSSPESIVQHVLELLYAGKSNRAWGSSPEKSKDRQFHSPHTDLTLARIGISLTSHGDESIW